MQYGHLKSTQLKLKETEADLAVKNCIYCTVESNFDDGKVAHFK